MFFPVEGHKKFALTADWEKLSDWLSFYEHSPDTYRNYRKELYRFLFYVYRIADKTLTTTDARLLNQYFHFLSNPPGSMLGPKVSIYHPEWKPLNKPMKPSSLTLTRYSLKVFFKYLYDTDYLTQDPIKLLPRTKTNHGYTDAIVSHQQTKRYLSQDTINVCIQTLQNLFDNVRIEEPENTYLIEKIKRANFTIPFLYYSGIRISELCQLNSDSFFKDKQKTNTQDYQQWKMRIVGKGSKYRELPMTKPLLQTLQSYLGCSIGAFVTQSQRNGASIPVLRSVRNPKKSIGKAAVSSFIKDAFLMIADVVELDHNDIETASLIRQCSAHWMRHSAGSHMLANEKNLPAVRDILGHGSITTTNTYIHADGEEALSASMESLHK